MYCCCANGIVTDCVYADAQPHYRVQEIMLGNELTLSPELSPVTQVRMASVGSDSVTALDLNEAEVLVNAELPSSTPRVEDQPVVSVANCSTKSPEEDPPLDEAVPEDLCKIVTLLDDLEHEYTLGTVLGSGSFGTVYVATLKGTRKMFACKSVELRTKYFEVHVAKSRFQRLLGLRVAADTCQVLAIMAEGLIPNWNATHRAHLHVHVSDRLVKVNTHTEVESMLNALGEEDDFSLTFERAFRNNDLEGLDEEVRLCAGLDHTHIVKLHAYVRTNSICHILMDLCLGGDLQSLITRMICKNMGKADKSPQMLFPKVAVANYAWQMLSSLKCLQSKNICHRDVKPSNYLVVDDSEDQKILKLADFGLAKRLEPGQMITGYAGTLEYMAPEVLASQYDYRCDVWSVGICIFEVCIGHPPIRGTETEIRQKLQSDDTDGLGAFLDINGGDWQCIQPKAIVKLILGLLSKDMHARWRVEEAMDVCKKMSHGALCLIS